MFHVRYELIYYILFRRQQVLKGSRSAVSSFYSEEYSIGCRDVPSILKSNSQVKYLVCICLVVINQTRDQVR
jgi:hypothetical protein